MKSAFTCILLILIFAVAGCKNDKTVLLRLKYEPGDKQKIIVKTKIENTGSDKIDNEIVTNFYVTTVKEGKIRFTAQVESIKSDINMGGLESHYDSNDASVAWKNDDMPFLYKVPDSVYTNMMYDTYSLLIDERGRIMEPFKSDRRKQTNQPFNFKIIQLSFPEKPVKVGFKWSEIQTSPLLNSENIFIYTVDDITEDGVVITVEVEVAGVKKKVKNLKGEGKYFIDIKNGHLLNAYIEIPVGSGKALISAHPE